MLRYDEEMQRVHIFVKLGQFYLKFGWTFSTNPVLFSNAMVRLWQIILIIVQSWETNHTRFPANATELKAKPDVFSFHNAI